ncbi:MAG: MraY family glycosyltransferase [candidate division Zixibacteria bacterium]
MSRFYIGSFVISFLAVIAFVPVVRRWALNIGFLDIPAGVKSHKAPTPLGGGLAVLAGSVILMTVVAILSGIDIPRTAAGIIAGTILIFLIGVYDDYYELGVLGKIVGQLIAALIFLTFVEKHPPIISFPAFFILTAVWIIGLQNAINFIDNLDGMCGGISLTIATAFGVLFIIKGMPIFAMMSFALAGGALGFLRYNLAPANIFLGDGGSLLYGFALSCLGIVHLNTSKSFTEALAPILIMAFPIFDMTLVTITRLNKGRKVYNASKDHAWDMIKVQGLTSEATVYVILLINLLLVTSGATVFFMGESPYRTLLVVGFALLLSFIGTQLYKNFLFLKERILALAIDLISINLAFWAYYLIKYKSNLLYYSTFLPPEALASSLAWINVFWIVLYAALGLYDISFEMKFDAHSSALAKSIIAGVLIFLLANFKPGVGFQVSFSSIVIFVGLLLGVSSLMRVLLHMEFSKKFKKAARKMNAVVVNPTGTVNAPSPDEIFGHRYNLVGYIGPDTDYGLKKLGDVSELENVLGVTKAARVILDIEKSDYRNLTAIFESPFYMETIFLVHAGRQDNLKGLQRYRSNNDNIDIISIRHRRLFPRIARRLLDLIVSIAGLLLSSPYWGIKILIAWRKENRIFEEVEIVSRGEKVAGIKTLSGNVGPVRIRNCLALLSLLRGDLSLYGPTITTADKYESSRDSIPGFWRKFLVKPGLFGPGSIGSTPRERFELDLAYMEKTSLRGDLLMMIRHMLGIPMSREIGTKNA